MHKENPIADLIFLSCPYSFVSHFDLIPRHNIFLRSSLNTSMKKKSLEMGNIFFSHVVVLEMVASENGHY